MNVHEALDDALRDLESTMDAANLWHMAPPPPDAYDSVAPFCVDTMALPQWLRFVLIARLDALVEARGSMPETCEVAPAVEAYLAQARIATRERRMLIQAVEEIDRLVTEN